MGSHDPSMLRVGDTGGSGLGVCPYRNVAPLMGRGVKLVVRNHRMLKSDFRKGMRPGKYDHVIVREKPAQKPCWMDVEACEAMPAEIVVRHDHPQPEEVSGGAQWG